MIIFSPIKEIPVEFLEYKGIRQVVTYNLTSYYNHAPTLNLLIPSLAAVPENILNGDCTTPEFDISYHSFIINNDQAFIQFMNIMVPVFNSSDTLVHVLINVSNFRDVITESLLKLIQQRYGYNAYIVNELDDFLYANESDFSIPGLFTMDKDIQRWQLMTATSGDFYE